MNERYDWADQNQARTKAEDPMFEELVVKNTGSVPAVYIADGLKVEIAPGDVQRLPRWVFHLGQKYPGHHLEELSPGEGSKEWEKAQALKLAAEVKAQEIALALAQKKLEDLKAGLKKRGRADLLT